VPSIEAKGILGQVLTQVFRFQPAVGSESVRTSSFDISRRASTWESNRTLGKITGTLPISMGVRDRRGDRRGLQRWQA
jgi:hypothetical protein